MHPGAEAPSGAGVSHGRALGDPMHPGGENPGGAPLGVLLVGASPSQVIPREAPLGASAPECMG